jgi:hypothetical protein
MQLLLVVNCCLEVGIKLRCSCQAVYCPGCAAGRSQGQKSGLQGFLLCTAQGTTEYFRISLEEDCPLVTRASVAFYSLHLCIVEGRSSAPCVSRLSPPPNNSRCWLSARSPPPLSPHHPPRRLCCQRATSPHDAAAARFTRTILLHTSTLDVPPTPLLPTTRPTPGRAPSLAPATLHVKSGSNNNHVPRQPQ